MVVRNPGYNWYLFTFQGVISGFTYFLTFCKATANILIGVTIDELINDEKNRMTDYRLRHFN